VAVLAGSGGASPLSSSFVDNPRPMPNGRLLVFKLGGRTPYKIERIENAPAVVVEAAWSAETVTHGAALYEATCGVCHGAAGISSGVLPDLRRSGVLADKDNWNAVVIGGALKERGMVSFAPWMSADDAEAIRAYVAGKAKLLAASEAKGG
jgi:quinohemoprotein ethanol dehydrogenase